MASKFLKGVTLEQRHKTFIDDVALDLSKFVRQQLDKEIKVRQWKK
jgi:hypothetical protein